MWSTQREPLANGRFLKFLIHLDSAPISYSEFLRRLQNDADFRSFFNSLLTEAPFSAFRWETPPVTAASAHRSFEFVLLDSPGLGQHPDPDAFVEHSKVGSKESVVSFPNLGNDAFLVVPCPVGPRSSYGHLGAFVREAPKEQIHTLWRMVGKLMEERLGQAPVWLSTAGAGVPWLHVRLDQNPKYYGYGPYRQRPRGFFSFQSFPSPPLDTLPVY